VIQRQEKQKREKKEEKQREKIRRREERERERKREKEREKEREKKREREYTELPKTFQKLAAAVTSETTLSPQTTIQSHQGKLYWKLPKPGTKRKKQEGKGKEHESVEKPLPNLPANCSP